MRTIRQVAEDIRSWVITDTRVEIDIGEIMIALQKDGDYMTPAECETFVCGTEDGGQVPTKLVKRFPNLNRLLNRHLT